jgi:hypothetical protein
MSLTPQQAEAEFHVSGGGVGTKADYPPSALGSMFGPPAGPAPGTPAWQKLHAPKRRRIVVKQLADKE